MSFALAVSPYFVDCLITPIFVKYYQWRSYLADISTFLLTFSMFVMFDVCKFLFNNFGGSLGM